MANDNNWKVEFQTAAGDKLYNVFEAEGFKSPVTMDLVTEDTFVHLGLVKMAHADHSTQSMGCDVVPLSDTWQKAVVTAQEFGLEAVEVRRADITEEDMISARNAAYMERKNNPEEDLFPEF